MKQLLPLTALMTGLMISAHAQTPLPYNSGFDNATQKSGWQSFRKGQTESTNWVYSEDFADGFTPASAPNCLLHPYPTAGGDTELTDDWFVSPGLAMTQGAKLSFKAGVYTIMGELMEGDTLQVYLLQGNANPSAATKTLLADIGYMQSTSYNFKDTANIIIPPTTGTSYIAFRYTSYHNWFTIAFDNIQIIANPTSGIGDHRLPVNDLVVYPNPAGDKLHWQYSSAESYAEGQITDLSGKTLGRFPLKAKQYDISRLQPGLYFLNCGAKAIPFSKQ